MKKKEYLDSRGFRDEEHLILWLEECLDKTLVNEVKEFFGLVEEVKELEVSEELAEEVIEEIAKEKKSKRNKK